MVHIPTDFSHLNNVYGEHEACHPSEYTRHNTNHPFPKLPTFSFATSDQVTFLNILLMSYQLLKRKKGNSRRGSRPLNFHIAWKSLKLPFSFLKCVISGPWLPIRLPHVWNYIMRIVLNDCQVLFHSKKALSLYGDFSRRGRYFMISVTSSIFLRGYKKSWHFRRVLEIPVVLGSVFLLWTLLQ